MSVAILCGASARTTDSRLWPWFSVTKFAVSCAALRLHTRGAIDLDAPLPGDAYSLRHLLSHTAGLHCYGALPAYHAAVAKGETPWSVDRLLTSTRADTPFAPPGEKWSYSNVGYLLALREITRLTALTPRALLQTEVITPLALQDTYIAEGIEPQPYIPGSDTYDFGWVYHHCLIGPTIEAARLVHMALNTDYLSDPTPITKRRPIGGPIPGRPWATTGYGMGCMTGKVTGAGLAQGHSGAGPISTCAVYHFPDTGLTAAAFSTAKSEATPERTTARLARNTARSCAR